MTRNATYAKAILLVSALIATQIHAQVENRKEIGVEPPLSSPPGVKVAPSTKASPSPERATLFDPSRHMRVSEARPGMKGYGLSVFKGTTIERFEVEVVSVVRNFNPGFDGVLIRCSGQNLEHTGSIAGMSGSPVYLFDDTGKARMIGAFAFGWNLAKDPIAGVQPIEYMLEYADPQVSRAGSVELKRNNPAQTRKLGWNLTSARDQVKTGLISIPTENWSSGGMTYAGVSWSMSGVSSRTLDQIMPLAHQMGLRNLAVAPGGAAGATESELQAAAKLEPGSSLVIPMVRGDIELSAVGTCTEVIGDRVFGFGHPFNGDGGVELPMAAGYVNMVVATLNSSFKLGAAGRTLGTLRADTALGVAGTVGEAPRTIPSRVRVRYLDGTLDRTYRLSVAKHPNFTPLLTLITAATAMNAVHELPKEQTLSYRMKITLAGGGEIELADSLPNASPTELLLNVATPLMMLVSNPFERLYPESITTEIEVDPVARATQIVSATVNKARYKPGEHVRVAVVHQPYRGDEAVTVIEVPLPTDIKSGEYKLVVSDKSRFEGDEIVSRPDRFSAENVTEMLTAMRASAAMRSDAFYVRIENIERGLAVGRAAMPNMPESKRTLIQSSGAPRLAEIGSSITRVLPAQQVVMGSAEVTVTVETGTVARKNGEPR